MVWVFALTFYIVYKDYKVVNELKKLIIIKYTSFKYEYYSYSFNCEYNLPNYLDSLFYLSDNVRLYVVER